MEVTDALFHDAEPFILSPAPAGAANAGRGSGQERQESAGGTRMSSISSLGASAALPSSGFHIHGHRKGAPVSASAGTDALTNTDNTADPATPATTQGIFSSLLQTVEQLVGVQLTAPPTSASSTTQTTPAAIPGGRIDTTA